MFALWRHSASRLAGLAGGWRPGGTAARLAGGAAWSLAGALASRGGQLLAVILLARFLGRSAYGEFCMVQTTIGMAGAMAGYGLGMTATQAIASHRGSDPARAGRIRAMTCLAAWGLGGLFALVLWLGASWLAASALAAPGLAWPLRIGALAVLFNAVTGSQSGALAGLESFKAGALVNFACGGLLFPALLGGAWLGGVTGAVSGLAVVAVVNWLLGSFMVARCFRQAGIAFAWRGCWCEHRLLWSFSVPAFLAGIMTAPVNWLSGAWLARQPGGYAELGLYNAVLRLRQAPEMLVGIVLAPMLPMLSHSRMHGARQRYVRLFLAGLAVSAAILVPVCGILLLLPELAYLPYGDQFHGGAAMVRWLMVQGMVLTVMGAPLGWLLATSNRIWLGVGYNAVWGACCLGLAWWLVPGQLATGLAASGTLAHLLTGPPFLALLLWLDRGAFRKAGARVREEQGE